MQRRAAGIGGWCARYSSPIVPPLCLAVSPRRKDKDLARVNQIRIADLLPVRLVNDGIARAHTISEPAEAPEAIAAGDGGVAIFGKTMVEGEPPSGRTVATAAASRGCCARPLAWNLPPGSIWADCFCAGIDADEAVTRVYQRLPGDAPSARRGWHSLAHMAHGRWSRTSCAIMCHPPPRLFNDCSESASGTVPSVPSRVSVTPAWRGT